VATENKDLTSAWQSLGAGPLTVALEVGREALLHSAASPPAADAAVQRLRSSDHGGPIWRTFYTTDNIYAKKGISDDVTVSYGE